MRFEINVKKKIGNPSNQRTLFDLDDTKDIERKLIDMKRDIVGDLKLSYVDDIKECITVSCDIEPAFSIDLDLDKNTVEDNERILDHVMKEIINRINIKKNGLYNYAPPHPIIPTYIGNGIGPQYNPANTVPYLNGSPFYYGFPIYNQSPCEETIKKHQEKDSDSTKKNRDLKSEETIGDEYLDKLMSAFNDFVSIVNDIYDEYKEVKELDEY